MHIAKCHTTNLQFSPPIPIHKSPTLRIKTEIFCLSIKHTLRMRRRDCLVYQGRSLEASWRWQMNWPARAIQEGGTHDIPFEGFFGAVRDVFIYGGERAPWRTISLFRTVFMYYLRRYLLPFLCVINSPHYCSIVILLNR